MKKSLPDSPAPSNLPVAKKVLRAFALLALVCINIVVYARFRNGKTPTVVAVPTLTYQSPKTYKVGTAASLKPTSSGVAALAYNTATSVFVPDAPASAAIATDAAGNVYVTGANLVFKKYPADGGTPVLLPVNHLVNSMTIDATGNIYFISSNNDIDIYHPVTSTIEEIYSGFGTGSFTSQNGIAVDGNGIAYATNSGNNSVIIVQAGAVRSIPAGVTILTGFNNPASVAVDRSGNAFIADLGSHSVKKIAAKTTDVTVAVSNIAGSFSVVADEGGSVYTAKFVNGSIQLLPIDGGAAIAAGSSFINPVAVSMGTKGRMYVTDAGNSHITEVDPAGGFFIDGILPAGLSFNSSTGLISGTPQTVNPSKTYAITAYNATGKTSANVVIKTEPAVALPVLSYNATNNFKLGDFISPITPASTGVAGLSYNNNSDIIISGITGACGIATDKQGNVYVARNDMFIKYGINGTQATVLSSTFFTDITGITVDTTGTIYAINKSNRIFAFNNTRISASVYEASGNPANGLNGITVDGSGNVYATNSGDNKVIKLPASNLRAPQTITGFNDPTGIAADGFGNIFVADQGSHSVMEIKAGSSTPVTFNSTVQGPFTVSADGAGNVYLVRFSNDGLQVSAVTGGPSFNAGSSFNNPNNVAIDGAGRIYVANAGNGQIRRVSPAGGYFINRLLPAGDGSGSSPLTFSNSTGVISGTIQSNIPPTKYAVTAYNAGGAANANLTITVKQSAQAPVISYISPAKLMLNQRTSIAPANSGGAVAASVYGDRRLLIGTEVPSIEYMAFDDAGNLYLSNGIDIYKLAAGATSAVVIVPQHLIGIMAGDKAGNLYVADRTDNAIKKIPAGSTTPVTIATGISDVQAMAVTDGGDIYFSQFGDLNKLKKIAAGSNVVSVSPLSFSGVLNIKFGGDGNLYIRDEFSTLTKISTDGQFILQSFLPNASVLDFFIDPIGNIFFSDNSTQSIGMISAQSGTVTNIANLFGPRAIAVDNTGNILVNDGMHSGALKLLRNGGYSIDKNLPPGLTFDASAGTISGTPTKIFASVNYKITGFNDSGNSTTTLNLAVVSTPVFSYNTPNLFSKGTPVNLSTTNTGSAIPAVPFGQVSTLAGSGTAKSTDGTGASASFNNPWGMAADANGNIYIADLTGNCIRKMAPNGTVTTFAGSGAEGAADGQGKAAQFKHPSGIAIDAAGNVYVGDAGNNEIRKITPSGLVSTYAGSTIAGNAGGTLANTRFSSPRGLTFDAAGSLYVADYGNNVLKQILPQGVTRNIAGGLNGPAAVTSVGSNVFVADFGDNKIWEISGGTGAGRSLVFAGSGAAGAADGIGTAATFKNPAGITSDPAGNLYVADRGNSLIRKITPNGKVTTFAGNGIAGDVDDVGTSASFNDPRSVVQDAFNNLYVAEYGGNRIRKISLTGYFIDFPLPPGLQLSSATGTISGIPTSTYLTTDYTVTAVNAIGTSTAPVRIGVSAVQPNISYTSNDVAAGVDGFLKMTPINTGSPIPATNYGTVNTLAGSGTAGGGNGTGKSASLNAPWGMATDQAGNIYEADYSGNLIRKITPAGVVTTFAGSGAAGAVNGKGTAATFKNPAGIAVDVAGNVYVGDSGNNEIRKITPSGLVTTFAGSITAGNTNGTGAAAKFKSPHGLLCDGAGNLYVADFGNNQVRKITSAGVVTTVAGSGSAGATNGSAASATFNGPAAITMDAQQNLYVADFTNNQIRKITSAGAVSTVAGSVTAGKADGPGIVAGFKNPSGIVADVSGNLYVADRGNSLIRKITPDGTVSTLAGTGTSGSVDGVGTAAKFNDPRGMAMDAAGNLYVGDFGGNQLRKITLTGYTIDNILAAGLSFDGTTGVISGSATRPAGKITYNITAYNAIGSSKTVVSIKVISLAPVIAYPPNNNFDIGNNVNIGPSNSFGAVPATLYSQVSTLAGTAAGLNNPWGMATDALGNIFVADFTNNQIRKITPDGVSSVFAGSGTEGLANGLGTAASFKHPSGIAIDAAGNLYVGDAGNNMIRKITPIGLVSTFAGVATAGSSNGTGTAAKFNAPRGLTFDAAGNLYVADFGNNMIRKITPDGAVTTLAGSTSAGSSNGAGASARFNGPSDITFYGNLLFVADLNNNMIRQITADGTVGIFAGSTTPGKVDGTESSASFKTPYGITVDNSGTLYVADRGNALIRKITNDGTVTTLAGTGASGSVNGVGTAASFNDPRGIVADGAGNLYVAEFGANELRKVLLTGYSLDRTFPPGLTFDGTTGIISGTSSKPVPLSVYHVTGYNAGGSSTAAITLKIIAPVPNISYPPTNGLTLNEAANIAPTNTGGPVPATLYGQTSTLTTTSAGFNNPWDMATDALGNIYVADFTNNQVRKITPAGVVSIFAGSGVAGSANGAGTAASFKHPSGIAVDAFGNVYVGDSGNNMIRKITPGGVVSTLAGKLTPGPNDGIGAAAGFNGPRGLTFDLLGFLYVADFGNNMIRQIAPDGTVTTVAGTTTPGSVDAIGAEASFNGPSGITSNGSVLYVADLNNNKIRQIVNGEVTTLAGSGVAGKADGFRDASSFKTPYGITIDNSGTLYVADRGNALIRKITPGGVVATLAGTGGSGSVNGVGIAASFNDPRGIATDAAGNLYVAEFSVNQVRKILLTGYTISPALSAGLTFSGTTGVISGAPTKQPNPATTSYTVVANNAGGSSSSTFKIDISLTDLRAAALTATPAYPVVKSSLSPNGDGIGDVLLIDNIAAYPDNTFKVMGRNGDLVYNIKGYDNTSKVFDGSSNITGKLQPAGTYFYQLQYRADGVVKTKTGYFLIRY